MYDYDLDPEEQEILDAYDRGEFVSVPNFPERKREVQESARYTLKKTRNINLRITELDYLRLKAKAIEEGLPYQTYAASILHKATR